MDFDKDTVECVAPIYYGVDSFPALGGKPDGKRREGRGVTERRSEATAGATAGATERRCGGAKRRQGRRSEAAAERSSGGV